MHTTRCNARPNRFNNEDGRKRFPGLAHLQQAMFLSDPTTIDICFAQKQGIHDTIFWFDILRSYKIIFWESEPSSARKWCSLCNRHVTQSAKLQTHTLYMKYISKYKKKILYRFPNNEERTTFVRFPAISLSRYRVWRWPYILSFSCGREACFQLFIMTTDQPQMICFQCW